jgi:hypothetical protein
MKSLVCALASAAALIALPAAASCRIHNDTGVTFTVESGNTSNQSVGSHTTTSIAAGRIIAKGDKGQSVGGSCKDGESIKIIEDRGALVIVPGN